MPRQTHNAIWWLALPKFGQGLPGATPQVIRVGVLQFVLMLVDVQEEDGEVEKEHNEEGHDEDNDKWREDPAPVVYIAEVVLKVSQYSYSWNRQETAGRQYRSDFHRSSWLSLHSPQR